MFAEWIEGEPKECDGSAWDRLPPVIRAKGDADMDEPMTLTERLYNPQYREPKDTDLIVLDTERTRADMREGALALDGEKVLRRALVSEIKRLTRTLEEANQMCRSAFQIAEREGAETNWNAFREGMRVALANQHAILHPKPDEQSSAKPL